MASMREGSTSRNERGSTGNADPGGNSVRGQRSLLIPTGSFRRTAHDDANEYLRLVNFGRWEAAASFYDERIEDDNGFIEMVEGLFIDAFYLQANHRDTIEHINQALTEPGRSVDSSFYLFRLGTAQMNLSGEMSADTAQDLLDQVEELVGRAERLKLANVGTLVAFFRIVQTGHFEYVVRQLPDWYRLRYHDTIVILARDMDRWFGVFATRFPQYFRDLVIYTAVTKRCSKRDLAACVLSFVAREHSEGEDEISCDNLVQAQMLAACAFFENPMDHSDEGEEGEEEDELCDAIREHMRDLHEYLREMYRDYAGSGLEARYRAAVAD